MIHIFPCCRNPILLAVVFAGILCFSQQTASQKTEVAARHHLETDSGSWSQYRGNARRTAFAKWRTTATPEILWSIELGSMIDSSPVIGPDGTIFVAGPKTRNWPMDQLIAVNPNGTIRWQTILEGYLLRATPAIRNDGTIVAVGQNIYADSVERDAKGEVTEVTWKREAKVFLVETDGRIRATTDQNAFFDGSGLTSPAHDSASDNTYYWHIFPLAGGNLRRFDSEFVMHGVGGLDVSFEGYAPLTTWEEVMCTTGILTLPHCYLLCVVGGPCSVHFNPDSVVINPGVPPIDPLTPSPSITQCNDIVAEADDAARFWLTGNRLWQKDFSASTTGAVGAGGRTYVVTRGSEEGRIEGYDQDGQRRFFHKLPNHIVASGPPALGRGVKDAADNSEVTCRRSTSERDHRVIIEDDADNLYVSGSDGNLYAIDYKGRLRWSVGPRFTNAPVVLGLPDGNDIVLIASQTPEPVTGLFQGLRASNGEQLWKLELDSPVRGTPAVDFNQNRIYVATQNSLYAIGYRRPPPIIRWE